MIKPQFDIVMPHTCRSDITKFVISEIPIHYRIILIDNSPFHEMSHIRHIRENVLWLGQPFPSSAASALNLGIMEVQTEWALLTPNDIVYSIKQLGRIVERFDGLIKDVQFVRSRNGANGLYHIPTNRKLGGFDENLPLRQGEELDMMYRFCKAGYKWRWADILAGYHIGGGRHTLTRKTEWAPDIPEEKRTYLETKWGFKTWDDWRPMVKSGQVK